jgi:hypothetical protein
VFERSSLVECQLHDILLVHLAVLVAMHEYLLRRIAEIG